MSNAFDNQHFDQLLKENLQNLEVPAPKEVWGNLEAELGFDQVLQDAFQQMEIPAPQGVLEGIQSQVTGSMVNGGLSLAGKWVITGLIGVTVGTSAYFISTSKDSPEQVIQNQELPLPQPELENESTLESGIDKVEETPNAPVQPEVNRVIPHTGGNQPNAKTHASTEHPPAGAWVAAENNAGPIEQSVMNQQASVLPIINSVDLNPAVSFAAEDTFLCIGQEYRIKTKQVSGLVYDVILNGEKKWTLRNNGEWLFTPEKTGRYQIELKTQSKDQLWVKRQWIVVQDKPTAKIVILDNGEGNYAFESASDGRNEWYVDGKKLASNATRFYDPIPTDHHAMLVKTNAQGCRDTAHMEFRNNVIFEISELVMPNTFTPNGDGKNDVYRVLVKGTTHFRMVIYNTNHQIVFETNDPEGSWDGADKFKGNVKESGTYTCLIEYAIAGGELKTKTELIHLITD